MFLGNPRRHMEPISGTSLLCMTTSCKAPANYLLLTLSLLGFLFVLLIIISFQPCRRLIVALIVAFQLVEEVGVIGQDAEIGCNRVIVEW